MKAASITRSVTIVLVMSIGGCQSQLPYYRRVTEEYNHLTPIDITRSSSYADYRALSWLAHESGWQTRGEVWFSVHLATDLFAALQERVDTHVAHEYRWRLLVMPRPKLMRLLPIPQPERGVDHASVFRDYGSITVHDVALSSTDFASTRSLMRELAVDTRPLPLFAEEPLGTDGYHMIMSYIVTDGRQKRAMSGEARDIYGGLPLVFLRIIDNLIAENDLPIGMGASQGNGFNEDVGDSSKHEDGGG